MRSSLVAAVAIAALICGHAYADEIDFTYTGTGNDGLQGTVQLFGNLANVNGTEEYQITGGSDQVIGGGGLQSTFNLVPTLPGFTPEGYNYNYSPSGYFLYDNVVFTDGVKSMVDYWGLLFANGSGEVNLFDSNSDPTGVPEYLHYDNSGYNEQITFNTLTIDAPEPATIAMFGVGLLGLGLINRRRCDAGTVV